MSQIAHMRSESSKKGAKCPSTFVLFVIPGLGGVLPHHQTENISYLLQTAHKFIISLWRRILRRDAMARSGRSFGLRFSISSWTRFLLLLYLLSVYASLRHTASLYKTRTEALSAQRLSAPRISALFLANAIAHASRSSASTLGALLLPLLSRFAWAPPSGVPSRHLVEIYEMSPFWPLPSARVAALRSWDEMEQVVPWELASHVTLKRKDGPKPMGKRSQ